MTAQDDQRKKQVAEICRAYPEVEVTGDQHLGFKVRNKAFAYYQNDHHGDNMISLVCKAPPGQLDFLLGLGEARFYKASYLGTKGWIAVRLDFPEIDWGEIKDFIDQAYRLTAPKTLVARLSKN